MIIFRIWYSDWIVGSLPSSIQLFYHCSIYLHWQEPFRQDCGFFRSRQICLLLLQLISEIDHCQR
jgi:hypothetical protein